MRPKLTVETFIRLLTDRFPSSYPRSKRLVTDERSNILIYMTGHGGNEFLKFQDSEEIGAVDLADAFEQMHEKRRYNSILFLVDTCQAGTLLPSLRSPNIIAAGSSKKDQSSYSHHADQDIGIAVIDRWTYYNLEFLEREVTSTSSNKTIGQLFDSYDPLLVHSDTEVRYDLFEGGAQKARERRVLDFFGNVQAVEMGGDTEEEQQWREDLVGLKRFIERNMQAREDAALHPLLSEATITAAEAPLGLLKKFQVVSAKATSGWSKGVGGAMALVSLGVGWSMASYFEY
ncbi:glycosylphosphatidylinositol anchor biosynthesis [Elasticomyces elasticus]|nr:glycosylphosphatidylinositol anchor biosynthesis [Elasticomyces elasticus]